MAGRAARAAQSLSSLEGVRVEAVLRCIDSLGSDGLCEPRAGSGGQALWKLYPWEWIIHEQLGKPYDASARATAAAIFAAEAAAFPKSKIQFWRLSGHSPVISPPPLAQAYEPPWKLVMSSKAMLAYLWAKHPGHKNLLPAAMADDLSGPQVGGRAADWVSKPVLGREGHGLLYGDEAQAGGAPLAADATLKAFAQSVTQSVAETHELPLKPPPPEPPEELARGEGLGRGLAMLAEHKAAEASNMVAQLMDRGDLTRTAAELDKTVQLHVGPSVLQRYYPLPALQGRKAVTSCWVVRGLPVSVCFREDTDRTTNNNSCFVPHWIEPSTAEGAEAGAGDGGERPCCPHRDFPLSGNQHRLREELYGGGGLASADLGAVLAAGQSADASEEERHHRHHYVGRCYGAGGYAGRGYSATGGGGQRGGSGTSGGGGRAAGWGGTARSRGDASARAAAKSAEQMRHKSGVAAKRAQAQSKAAAEHAKAKMNVGASRRQPGSTGRRPGFAHSPPGSTGHSTSGGYSG